MVRCTIARADLPCNRMQPVLPAMSEPRFPLAATALAAVTVLLAALSLMATLSSQPADIRLGALGLLGGLALILACIGAVLFTGALRRLMGR